MSDLINLPCDRCGGDGKIISQQGGLERCTHCGGKGFTEWGVPDLKLLNGRDAENMDTEKLISKFQCPGCVNGSSTDCGVFKLMHQRCESHVLGTRALGIGPFALGLPRGFNRPGFNDDRLPRAKIEVRFWTKGEDPGWDHLNVAVWALEEDGFLFVRTFLPRTNVVYTDVIEGGTLALVPKAIDVSKFYDDID